MISGAVWRTARRRGAPSAPIHSTPTRPVRRWIPYSPSPAPLHAPRQGLANLPRLRVLPQRASGSCSHAPATTSAQGAGRADWKGGAAPIAGGTTRAAALPASGARLAELSAWPRVDYVPAAQGAADPHLPLRLSRAPRTLCCPACGVASGPPVRCRRNPLVPSGAAGMSNPSRLSAAISVMSPTGGWVG